ncbi:galactokinase [Haliangium sp.]|uniref:galactokinase n=1 Tax=Haliangium sp. TaxID=2663208 RepID=UPI003D0A16A9
MTSAPSPRDRAAAAFVAATGAAPTLVVRAPGRVNLIGEHTDYNDGFVLPMAIDHEVAIALSPEPGEVRVRSCELGRERRFTPAGLTRESAPGGWLSYIAGVAWALAEAGRPTPGWRGVVASDVPIGAGLSSSAALELAALRAFVAVAGGDWDPRAMAALAQRAESAWVGMNCGIMDQLTVAAGQRGQALFIDCRSLAIEPVPVPAEAAVLVLDTDTRRGLVDSAYNQRRAQCEQVARALGVAALRDADLGALDACRGALDPEALRRARHVIGENERVRAAAQALRAGDVVAMGQLMNHSHASLARDFEVSSPALDAMVRHAQAHPGCHGARLTGAGFAGCAVALVDIDAADDFINWITRAYQADTGRRARVYPCAAAPGASVLAAPNHVPGAGDNAATREESPP